MKRILILMLFTLSLQAKSVGPFSLPIYGEENDFSYKPGKVTLMNFWASWCTSCIQEIPELEALKKKYPKVEFLAVNAGDTKRKIKKFITKHKFSFKVLMDKDKNFSKGMDVLNLPQTIVVDEKGEVIYRSNTPPRSI